MTRRFEKLRWLPLLYSVTVLILLSWLNRRTPYRGEHWAVMNAYLNSPDLSSGLKNILHFECFGNQRFQPLTFFASLIPYWLFRHQFLFHYLLTSVLHIWVVHSLLVASHIFIKGQLKFRGLFKLYTLEASLLMVSFFAADVITWSMYVYLQLACVLLFYGIAFYNSHSEGTCFFLLGIATFLYEPVFGVLAVFVACSCLKRSGSKAVRAFGLVCSLVLGVLLYKNYQLHLNGISSVIGQSSGLLELSTYHKLILVCVKALYTLATMATHILFPQSAVRGNIFELQFLLDSKIYLLIFAIMLLGVLIKLSSKNEKLYPLCLSGFLLFAIIAWGRSDLSPYVIRQFRYAYVLSGFFFIGILWRLQELRIKYPYGYSMIFLGLIAFHSAATLRHGQRVEESMRPAALYFSSLGNDEKKAVKELNEAISYGKLDASKELTSFVYNANSCMYQWIHWLKG